MSGGELTERTGSTRPGDGPATGNGSVERGDFAGFARRRTGLMTRRPGSAGGGARMATPPRPAETPASPLKPVPLFAPPAGSRA